MIILIVNVNSKINLHEKPNVACFHREREIVSRMEKYIGKIATIIGYIFFASFLVYLEDVVIGYKLYKTHKKFLRFLVVFTSFVHLSQSRQKYFGEYYEEICKHHLRRLFVVGRESSVQLVLQNTILIYDYFHQPAMELYFPNYSNPTAWWGFINFIRITSVIISSYCTMMPLMEEFNMSCYKKFKKPATVFQYILYIIKISVHILISTVLVYLKWFFK